MAVTLSGQKRKAVAILVLVHVSKRIRKYEEDPRKRRHSCWVKPWILDREDKGAYHNLIEELRLQDLDSYRNFLRMDVNAFEELLALVTPIIQRRNTQMRTCIEPAERLAVTLRFIATEMLKPSTRYRKIKKFRLKFNYFGHEGLSQWRECVGLMAGDSYRSLSYLYRIGRSTIGKVVPETCHAIYTVLKSEHMQTPTTPAGWHAIADRFQEKWQFPNCLGALDGKHITIRPPPNTGSMFFNYKHTFSIVLMALVDADYRFIYVDVGANGRVADSGVFRQSTLDQALSDNMLGLPDPAALPGTNVKTPFAIVADEAFPLRNDLMKPFPHKTADESYRVFNYRLSRARRCVENGFGILANRFRVFLSPIALPPKTVEKVVLASCALHNFLRNHDTAASAYTPTNYIDHEDHETHRVAGGMWRASGTLEKAPVCTRQRHSLSAKDQREVLRQYFSSPMGIVPWQQNMI